MRKTLTIFGVVAAIIVLILGVLVWAQYSKGEIVDTLADVETIPANTSKGARDELEARIEQVRFNPEKTVVWNALGDQLFFIGAYRNAERIYQKSLQIDDYQPGVWAMAGEARVRQSAEGAPMSGIARNAFERAVQLDPGNARARFYLAVADYNAGKRSVGITAMKRLLQAAKPGTTAHDAATQTLALWTDANSDRE